MQGRPRFRRLDVHEAAADEVEGELRGPFADALAIAAEGAVDGVGALRIRDGNVDEADRFGIGGAVGAGNAGNAESQGCAGARADAFGKCLGDFSGDRAVPGDEIGGTSANVVLSGSE